MKEFEFTEKRVDQSDALREVVHYWLQMAENVAQELDTSRESVLLAMIVNDYSQVAQTTRENWARLKPLYDKAEEEMDDGEDWKE